MGSTARRPRTMLGRLIAWQLSLVLLLLAALGFVLDRALERNSLEVLTRSLESEARTLREALPLDEQAQAEVVRLGEVGDLRITLIRTDGKVLADSERDPADMVNHAGRPEVRAALDGRVGTAARRSETTRVEYRYVALPPRGGVILRVALPLTSVRQQQAGVRLTIVLGFLATAAAATAAVLLVNRGVVAPLKRITRELSESRDRDEVMRVRPMGTEEVATLANAFNRMADRLESEMRSTRAEQRLRDLVLSSMEEGVVLVGGDGDVRFANHAVTNHLGTVPARLDDVAQSAVAETVERARREGRVASAEFGVGAAGRWVRCSAVPAGSDGSVIVVLHDVTAARRVEAVRRDFVANASHELKTPAASIRAAAETVRHAAVDDPAVVPAFAAQLERDAMRLSGIVSDLLDLSRLESGPAARERVALGSVVEAEVQRLRDEAGARDIELAVDAPREVTLRGSRRDLGLLVGNLLDNAVRYTAAGGRVEVGLTTADGHAVLRVVDTGTGIPSRDLPRIFERFYRVDRARSRETGGTGLGLSIVKHVAENHGGTVTVDSELGRGSTFEVRLPLEH